MGGSDWRDRIDRAATWLDASKSELLGLFILACGSLAATALFWWTGAPRPVDPVPVPTSVLAEETPAEIVVHVSGAVHRPGVVRVTEGARIDEVLAAAGGPRGDAVLDALNLARKASDGERVHVPVEGEELAMEGARSSVGAHRPDGTLDLNAATAADLEELPGIGPVLAQRIIDWRDANGPFTEKGQLREVSGIGERVFQNIAELVSV